MGHKAHPIGLRLGIHRKWKSNWYFDSKNYTKFLHLNFDIEKYFKGILYFYPIKTILINCQIVKLPSNQIFIFVFFYRLRRRFKKIKNNLWKTKKWKYNLEKSLTNKQKEIIPFQYSSYQENKYYLKEFINKGYNLNINPNHIILNNILSKNHLLKYHYTLFNNFAKIFSLIKKIFKHNKLNIILIKTIYKLNYIQKLNLYKILLLNNNDNIILYNWKNNIKLYLYKNKNFYNQFNYIYILNKSFDKSNFFFFKKNRFITSYKKNINVIKNNNFKLKLKKINFLRNKYNNKLKNKIYFNKNLKISLIEIKKFLSLITNSKINIIFINTLSFCKFYYYTQKKNNKSKQVNERFNIWPLQRFLFNRFKYSAIFIKDFIHLTFISVLIKNPQVLVNFIGYQFKHLPKNRKQLKLLSFITQTIKILCEQRREIIGFKLQLKGRLNRRTRTKVYNFKKGVLPIQTNTTRVEYGYSEGFTRSGLIGIKLWIFYNKIFKNKLKKKLLEYLLYSKYKMKFNFNLFLKKFLFLKKKTLKKNKNIIFTKNKVSNKKEAEILKKLELFMKNDVKA
jgi:hypothetical protein